MKNIIIGCALFLGTTTVFSQEITSKEKKGNNYFFLYDYDNAVKSYNSSKTLTMSGRRNLAECYAKQGNFKDAETMYAYIVNSQDVSIPEDYFAYAMVLKSANRFDDYAIWMNKLVETTPNDLRGKSFTANLSDYDNMSTDKKTSKVNNLEMNSESQDYAATFYKDEIVFTSTNESPKMIKRTDNWTGLPYTDMKLATLKDDQFTKIRKFDKKLNSKMHDGPASFSADGNFMAYTTNNQNDKSKDKVVELLIFTSEKINDKWSKPVAFNYNNPSFSIGQPCLTKDGKTMYFTSDMPGGFGGTDIYVSTLRGKNDWTKPINLGDKVNTESDEMFPFFDESNDVLYFASDGHFGLGGLDIFNSYKMNDQFGMAKNLERPFNTEENDFAFIVNPETRKGYLSSNRVVGKGNSDIYSFTLMKDAKLEKEIIGISLNTQGENVPATFVVLKDENNKGVDSMYSDSQGAFTFKVKNDKNYTLTGKKDKYNDGTTAVSSYGTDEKIVADVILTNKDIVEVIINEVITGVIAKNDTIKNVNTKDILSEKVELGQLIKLKPIYYDFDKSIITPTAVVELDKIVKIMNKYPNIEIELASYTDCRGTIEYNEILSQSRATASIDYIKKRITNPTRIYGTGYGETKLLNSCACEGEVESSCSDAEHQVNRRTEFVIKK